MFHPEDDIIVLAHQKSLYNAVNHDINPLSNISGNLLMDDDELPTYCNFCLANFKQYYELVNGVCQSCGRIPSVINKNKQPDLEIRSLNAKEVNDPLSSGKFDCVSLEYDYKDFNEENEATRAYTGEGEERMKANSLREAMQKIHDAEKRYVTKGKPLYKAKTNYKDYSHEHADFIITKEKRIDDEALNTEKYLNGY